MYFHIPGRSYLVLNSLKTATELLDQRSGIYSDHMRFAIFDIMGWRATLTLLPYGKHFQKHRRLLQEYLHEKQCLSYQSLQIQHAHRLLAHLMDHPGDWMKHIERFAAALIVKIVYGMDLADNDPYLDITEKKEGTAQPSFPSFHLSQLHGVIPDEEHVEDLQGSAGAMFAGGAETVVLRLKNHIQTASAISLFVFAMVLFPDVQEKAQQEIDDIVGKDRLPEMGDRASLPYIDAVLYEVLRYRWNTVVPNVIANTYAILRDETIYSDPDSFNLSRYLPKPEGKAEPYSTSHFGFGQSHPKPFPCTIKPRDKKSESMIRQAQLWDNN
ncbi:cytochrome P450 [Cyathus striatus]|nr:cytochrome P450 [Cyathus striatus]